jgi:multidrug efflux pump
MRSLWEAILLVVVIALLGFREWRSALLVALSIPLTLAMTCGMMRLLDLVPALYAIAVLDLKLIRWEIEPKQTAPFVTTSAPSQA